MNISTNVSDIEVYINVAVSALITSITIPSNFIIVIIFWRDKRLRDLNNTAITMLSVTDFLRGCIVMTTKIHNQLASVKTLNPAMCHITALMCAFSFVFSPLVLALIAFVRYCMIVPRPRRIGKLTVKKFNIISAVLFSVALFFSVLPYMGVGDYAYSESHGVCFADWRDVNRVFRTIFYMLVIGIAFPVLTISYARLYFALHKHNKSFVQKATAEEYSHIGKEQRSETEVNSNVDIESVNEVSVEYRSSKYKERSRSQRSVGLPHTSTNDVNVNKEFEPKSNDIDQQERSSNNDKKVAVIVQREIQQDGPSVSKSIKSVKHNSGFVRNISKQEYQVTKLLILIFIAYCVCWIPAAVVNIVALTHIDNIPKIWFYIIVTMVELKSALDPLIYGLGNRKYRIAFMNLWKEVPRKFSQYSS